MSLSKSESLDIPSRCIIVVLHHLLSFVNEHNLTLATLVEVHHLTIMKLVILEDTICSD